jgi:hypothetical protein
VSGLDAENVADYVTDPNPAPYCSIGEWLAWCEREEKRKANEYTHGH